MAKKLALLVGCNYSDNATLPGEKKLHGCINDVKVMQALISHRFGFQDKNITILTDETNPSPTFANIIAALKRMVSAARADDNLLFYFSGGGALKSETTGVVPAIMPWDLYPITGNLILDIITPLPATAIFTFICDSSFSGGFFDKNVQIQSNVSDSVHNFGSKTIPSHFIQPVNFSVNLPADAPFNNGIMFSSSKANEESVEVYPNGDRSKAFSAYGSAIQAFFNSPIAVEPTGGKTNGEVEAFATKSLGNQGFDQHPRLIPNENNVVAALFLGGYAA